MHIQIFEAILRLFQDITEKKLRLSMSGLRMISSAVRKTAAILDDDFIVFIGKENYIKHESQLPRRYFRGNENVLESYNDEQLYKRYRFTKDTVLNDLFVLLPVENPRTDCGLLFQESCNS
ncbi:hypothetical protein ANN_07869 [Periplaneta americana]|uniref:Uncharacterized protein n=1 Tax=Periplaneta americana TaxID=6978 RepID=A0ABQ8T171_PERAM|nr:hypothetical protein ANN_07869 [Periplaneta americana]